MALEPGTNLGVYEICAPLGAGGMGEVYLARDTKLDRQVAIKVLPEELTRDPERIARFDREAKLLASLNHSNIAAVFGFDESNGARFLVMEYVEGQTLSRRLDAGALPIDEALDIARQIAEALEEAHDRSIVHRDLKPGNVIITPDGRVKVLDFGLAKAMADDPSSVTDMNSPTITVNFTRPGVVLGTAAYMSPEQARGRAIDKRTDIWAFGVVLYEMLSGISPFTGETVSDSIGAILHKDVDLDMLPATSSPTVRRVLTRCLQRDRKRRLRDIADARLELEGGADDSAALGDSSSRRPTSSSAFAALLIVGGLVGALAGFEAAQKPPPPLAHLSIEPPPGTRVRYSGDIAGPAVVSPDGTMIAFSAARKGEPLRLWVRSLDEPSAREIAGTDGAMFPFWSPDSATVGFFTLEHLRRVDLASGTMMTVCNVTEARGGCWTYDDRIILSPAFSSPLYIVNASGGSPQPITALDDDKHTTHRWPTALVDGRRFLYFASHRARSLRAESQGVYLGYLDGSAPRLLLRTEFGATYVKDRLLFVRDGVLLASRVDLDQAKLVGELTVVARNLAADSATWHHQFSASEAGLLAFNRRALTDSIPNSTPRNLAFEIEADTVDVFDRAGDLLTNYADGVPHSTMAISDDSRSLALSVPSNDGTLDLWIYPTGWVDDQSDRDAFAMKTHAAMRPNPRRLTFLEGSEDGPVWSPNSDEIAFARLDVKNDEPGIYRKRIGGGQEDLLLAANGVPVWPTDWTKDGKYIVYARGAWQTTNALDIWALPLDGGEPFALVQSPLLDTNGTVSPDGRWLAYKGRETMTQIEVYVIPFAPAWDEDQRARRWQVSLDGGNDPSWSPDGKALFYLTRSGMLMEVSVDVSADSFEFTSPRAVFQTPWEIGSSYGVFPNRGEGGAAFVFNDMRQALDAPISVILNWERLLEDK